MTAYRSNIINYKMDEDPLQSRIYFLTFIESLEMIFSQYKETCEVLIDYPKIVGEDMNKYVKNSVSNLLNENICVHSRRSIADFPVDGVKFISKLQSHCANMIFSDKRRYDGIFHKVTHKVGES